MTYPGLTLELCRALPSGFFALRREGHVVDHGRMANLSAMMQPGDVVLVGEADWRALQSVAVTTGPTTPCPNRGICPCYGG